MKRAVVALCAAVSGLIASAVVAVAPTVAPEPALAAPSPIIVIFMENKERSTIENSADADYLKSFENSGRSFTHYYGVAHPSLPNYLGFASGSTKGKVGTDSINTGEITGANLWSQAQTNAVSWGVYEESMPSACYGGSSGQYQLKHNPAMPFANIANRPKRCAKVVPYTQFNVNALPSISFITPNMCNDMHDCSVATGDNWLQARVPAMLAAGATVVITFDEGSSGTNGGGNVYAAVDGPGIASSTNTTTYNHYSLLAAIEARFGLPKLGAAKTAGVLPL
jgi:phosphatidylinositol-3-phosphatase